MQKVMPRCYLLMIYSLLYIPIIVLILYSMNNAKFSLIWHGFSIRWYQELLHDQALWLAFFNSIFLGISAATCATLIGIFACINLFLNRNAHYKPVFQSLILMLIILPDLVLGVALLIFFNITHIELGFFSLLIAHITFCLPFVVLTIQSRIHTLDVKIYDSALDLGATKRMALHKIILPILYPAILSAFLLAFTLSFDDVMISYFVAGPEFSILPLRIYSLVRAGVTPELNALCSVVLFISILIVGLSYHLSRRSACN